MTDARITVEELAGMFPCGVPVVAVKLLFPEKSSKLTLAEIRTILRALAADKQPPAGEGGG